MKTYAQRIIKRTKEIVVGKQYFLSSFGDKEGAFVTVLTKSTKINAAGWPSSVEVQIDRPVGEGIGTFYKVDAVRTVNATNLYERQSDASAEAKFGKEGGK